MDKELLVKRLKELSEEKKITLTKAFIESGVGKNFISNMKTSNPSMGKITMLANYFNVSVDYLLGKTPSPERDDIPEDEKRLRDLLSQMSEEQLQMAYKIISAIAEEK